MDTLTHECALDKSPNSHKPPLPTTLSRGPFCTPFPGWQTILSLTLQGWFVIRIGDRIQAHHACIEEGTA